jgi:hypothetical protein
LMESYAKGPDQSIQHYSSMMLNQELVCVYQQEDSRENLDTNPQNLFF